VEGGGGLLPTAEHDLIVLVGLEGAELLLQQVQDRRVGLVQVDHGPGKRNSAVVGYLRILQKKKKKFTSEKKGYTVIASTLVNENN
jgi:hypothetical protein